MNESTGIVSKKSNPKSDQVKIRPKPKLFFNII